mgnify:CR=1 FL=1
MLDKFIIEGVPYYSQRDNQYQPNVSCFPTSMAMAMAYCLDLIHLDKTAVGCHPNIQLEDYLNELIYDNQTKEWMIQNQGRIGSWIWKYQRRTIYVIEAYIFNRLMNQYGYNSKYVDLKYDDYCNNIENTKLPIIVGGNFSSVSRVGGHVCCGIGFNRIGLPELIVRDPFGNALKGYPQNQSQEQNDKDGYENAYGLRFFGNGKFASILIERI